MCLEFMREQSLLLQKMMEQLEQYFHLLNTALLLIKNCFSNRSKWIHLFTTKRDWVNNTRTTWEFISKIVLCTKLKFLSLPGRYVCAFEVLIGRHGDNWYTYRISTRCRGGSRVKTTFNSFFSHGPTEISTCRKQAGVEHGDSEISGPCTTLSV